MSDWRAVGCADGFALDTPCAIEVDVSETERLGLVVVRRPDAHHVFLDRCPHRGAAFSDVGCVDTEDGLLVCGWHYWAFHLKDGVHTVMSSVSVPRYPTRVVDGTLEVDVAPPAPPPPTPGSLTVLS